VVVGLSLRDPYDELFEFAFSAAAARGVPLRAVHGHEVPVQAHMPWGVDPEVAAEITDKAQKKLRKQLRPWRKKFRGVRVIKVLTLDSPARAVVHDTQTAGLLVVGRRRHQGALAPRLGPVAQAAVHHAAVPSPLCPVAEPASRRTGRGVVVLMRTDSEPMTAQSPLRARFWLSVWCLVWATFGTVVFAVVGRPGWAVACGVLWLIVTVSMAVILRRMHQGSR
jgi:hypothetical protein